MLERLHTIWNLKFNKNLIMTAGKVNAKNNCLKSCMPIKFYD